MNSDDALSSGVIHTSEKNLELAGLTTGVLVLLAAIWSLLGHFLSSHSRYLNESGTACLLGLAAGVVLLASRDHSNAGLVDGLLRFNSAAFFTYLLPPVIFYAGLSVEQRLFFSNLPSILSFGVLGTLVSFVLISAALYSLAGTTIGMDAEDCLALGAVFAATDSVAVLGLLDPRTSPQLFSLVFGEGIVNDATSVVLLGALARMARQQRGGPHDQLAADPGADSGQGGAGAGGSLLMLVWRLTANFGYLLLTSTVLGVAAGMGIAMLLRHRVASQGPHHEVAVVGLLAYLTYLAAEVLGLSAILSLFCCGATVSRFALRNGTMAQAPSLDPSMHGGHVAGNPGDGCGGDGGGGGGGGNCVSTMVTLSGRRANGDAATVIATANAAESPRESDGSRHWYNALSMYGCGGDSRTGRHDGGWGSGAGVMLWALAAPAKRLAARAFGGAASCMSTSGASTTINAFRSLSYVAEGLIFVYLGLDCLDPVRWEASYVGEVVWLVGLLLFFMLAARAASVVPLSMLHNLYVPRDRRLSGRDMLVIWWSGLMRGAVSVALVYLNFDTADGSRPAPAAIVSPNVTAPNNASHQFWPNTTAAGAAGAVGLRRVRLLQEAVSAAVAAAASAASLAASEPDNPAYANDSAAMALASALAEANEVRARQHATLIVATLLVVVASVLVVSTLTKPLLQAALEADPRKPPLKVLAEALFDPWVDATWRLQVALGRGYRRLTAQGAASPDSAAEEGESVTGSGGGGGAGPTTTAGVSGPSIRRAAIPASGSSLCATHTIPMATLGLSGGARGSSLSLTVSGNLAATAGAAAGDGLVGRSLSVGAPDASTSHPYGKGASGQQGQSAVAMTAAGGAERARLRFIVSRKGNSIPPTVGREDEPEVQDPGDTGDAGSGGPGAGVPVNSRIA